MAESYIIHQTRKRVVIITGMDGSSTNPKTGPVAQVWILPADKSPLEAVRTNTDDIICGDCSLRAGNGCYVQVRTAPSTVWRVWQQGKLRHVDEPTLRYLLRSSRLGVRLGAYGDPAYIPVRLLRAIRETAAFTLGYTHQWRGKSGADRLPYCMASCDSEEDRAAVKRMDPTARTFRIISSRQEPLPGEILCPNSSHGVRCSECRLCDGGSGDPKRKGVADIVIRAHGGRKRIVENLVDPLYSVTWK